MQILWRNCTCCVYKRGTICKVTNIQTNTNKGVLYNYLNLLANNGAVTPRGIFYNHKEFIICDIVDSKTYYGSWETLPKSFITPLVADVPLPKLTADIIDATK